MSELALVPIVFITSCLTAVIGMGGGVLLLTLMPGLVPTPAILPVHALTQLASNLSRAAFGWRAVDLAIVPAFTLGALAGGWLGAQVYQWLDERWLPALIGGFILVFTWLPLPVVRGEGSSRWPCSVFARRAWVCWPVQPGPWVPRFYCNATRSATGWWSIPPFI